MELKPVRFTSRFKDPKVIRRASKKPIIDIRKVHNEHPKRTPVTP